MANMREREMVTINGKSFAENDNEMTDSVFQKGGTCVGFIKRNKRSITIMDHQKIKVGVINREGVIGSATLINGNWWYSYADVKLLGEFESYSAQVDVARQLSVGRDAKGYLFK